MVIGGNWGSLLVMGWEKGMVMVRLLKIKKGSFDEIGRV